MSYAMGEKELVLSLRAQGASAAEVRNLVAVAGALAVVPDPEIDATFADALEARLMTEGLETAVRTSRVVTPLRRAQIRPAVPVRRAPAPRIATVTQLPRRRFVIRKTLAAAIAAAMLLALPVAAGANALPSSPAYSVKMALENFRMHLTTGEMAKAFYELQRASTRLGEIEQTLTIGDTTGAAEAARRMKNSQSHAGRLILAGSPSTADLRRAVKILRGQAANLADLLPKATGKAVSPMLDAIRTSQALANEVAAELGAPPAAPIALPATGTESASSDRPTTAGPSSSDRGAPDAGKPVDGKTTDDANTRVHNATQPTCQAPGSANGLGEILAPLAKVICGR